MPILVRADYTAMSKPVLTKGGVAVRKDRGGGAALRVVEAFLTLGRRWGNSGLLGVAVQSLSLSGSLAYDAFSRRRGGGPERRVDGVAGPACLGGVC